MKATIDIGVGDGTTACVKKLAFHCPHCHNKIPVEKLSIETLRRWFAQVGGKASGPRKARTSEQARAAGILGAQKRWGKIRLGRSESMDPKRSTDTTERV
jgi:hypothetical protein